MTGDAEHCRLLLIMLLTWQSLYQNEGHEEYSFARGKLAGNPGRRNITPSLSTYFVENSVQPCS